jgi:pimeloyl-ACP methyl ester carboxylesterase
LYDTRFGQMHVRASDGEGVPLLALHMSPLSSEMWLPLMERVGRPVVAPDRLGFGFSDPPPRDLTMDEYASATLDALDAIYPGVAVDVVGEHTGSVEAVALAHLVPDRVRKVALIALPVYSEEERAERMGTRGAPPVEPDADGSQFKVLWERRLAYRKPPYDFAHLHDLTVQELVSAGPYLAYRAVFSYPMAERLAGLPVPAVVFAPHDDLSGQTARAARLLREGSEYVDLPDLALDLFHEAPDRMVALIEDHLGDGLDVTPIQEEE